MAKRKRIDDESKMDVGMVMTVSLFLIILTFFILLNSIAVRDEKRTKKAIGSLVGAFGNLTGGLSPFKSGENIIPTSAPITERDFDVNEFLKDENNNKILGDMVKVERKKGREFVTIYDKYLFDIEKMKIKPSAISTLKKIGKYIKKGDYFTEIIGYTDNLSAIDKGYGSNFEISSLKTALIFKLFVEEFGLDPEKIVGYGRGSLNPIASNLSPETRELNNRVEIKITHKLPYYIKKIFKKEKKRIFTYKDFSFRIN